MKYVCFIAVLYNTMASIYCKFPIFSNILFIGDFAFNVDLSGHLWTSKMSKLLESSYLTFNDLEDNLKRKFKEIQTISSFSLLVPYTFTVLFKRRSKEKTTIFDKKKICFTITMHQHIRKSLHQLKFLN